MDTSQNQDAAFDHIMRQLFELYGGEYHPTLESDYEIELTMDSGQQLVFFDNQNHDLDVFSDLGEAPARLEEWTMIGIVSNQELDQSYPAHFFLSPNEHLCVRVRMPYQSLDLKQLDEQIKRVVEINQWYHEMQQLTPESLQEKLSEGSMKV